jgi:hypothetical protein
MGQLSTEDRLAIHEIMAKYCQAIDLNRWEEFRACSPRIADSISAT